MLNIAMQKARNFMAPFQIRVQQTQPSEANSTSADPLQALAIPEMLEDVLEHGSTNCISFNRKGTLLAGMPQLLHTTTTSYV